MKKTNKDNITEKFHQPRVRGADKSNRVEKDELTCQNEVHEGEGEKQRRRLRGQAAPPLHGERPLGTSANATGSCGATPSRITSLVNCNRRKHQMRKIYCDTPALLWFRTRRLHINAIPGSIVCYFSRIG